MFLPCQTPYAWASSNGGPARIIDVYQPAGRIEEFFRELSKFNSGPPVHEVLSIDEFRRLYQEHGMELTGPPIVGEWKVEDGRIMQVEAKDGNAFTQASVFERQWPNAWKVTFTDDMAFNRPNRLW